ncbi:Uncharacterized protein Fot_22594 [Forsythia ovata]|uniref:Uncharacterized protein n=1 Tax=Forsythia ovata TaxID=205694 RepID=A0ABD1UY55_9LAMI
MSGFYFFKVPKFKIRRGRVVEDISPPPLVPSVASGPRSTVLQVPEMTRDSSYIPPAPEATSEVPSTSISARPMPSPGSARQSEKRKVGAKSREKAFQAPTSSPPGKYEFINIGSRQDELDPTVLGKLPPPTANAAASVHKFVISHLPSHKSRKFNGKTSPPVGEVSPPINPLPATNQSPYSQIYEEPSKNHLQSSH